MSAVKRYFKHQRDLAMDRCNDIAGAMLAKTQPECLLDVGCGDGALIFRYIIAENTDLYGVELNLDLAAKAKLRGVPFLRCPAISTASCSPPATCTGTCLLPATERR